MRLTVTMAQVALGKGRDLIMSTESIMWLFPIVFMIHEFEEIIFLPRWLRRNRLFISKNPQMADNLDSWDLSTTAFAAVVLDEYILLAAITLVCVEYRMYSLFAAVTIGYLIHVCIHVGQALFLQRYIPAVGSGVFTAAYNCFSLYYLNMLQLLNWNSVAFLSPLVILFIGLNLVSCHKIVKVLEINWE